MSNSTGIEKVIGALALVEQGLREHGYGRNITIEALSLKDQVAVVRMDGKTFKITVEKMDEKPVVSSLPLVHKDVAGP